MDRFIKFARTLYILHVFQKKSKLGINSAKQDIALIKQRLAVAQKHDKAKVGLD